MFPSNSFIDCWANESDVLMNVCDMAPTSFASHCNESLHIPLDKEVAWLGQVRRIFMMHCISYSRLGALLFLIYFQKKKEQNNKQLQQKVDSFVKPIRPAQLFCQHLLHTNKNHFYMNFHWADSIAIIYLI